MGADALFDRASGRGPSAQSGLNAVPRDRAATERGQATIEWIGLVALVAVLVASFLALLGAFGRLPGVALASAIAERIVCAATLGGACSDDELSAAYGPDVAALLAEHAPLVRYEPGMRALPVDYRRCRADACAEGSETGSIWRSRSGEPVVAFTHVVDCRAGFDAGPGGGSGGVDCSGRRAGNLYLQYWFYYPGSATGEGSIPGVRQGIRWASTKLGRPSYHRDDWESYQVRVAPDGGVCSRASSHRGHVYSGAGGDAPARAGRVPGSTRVGGSRLERGRWGPSRGSLYVSGGSHAGWAVASAPSVRLTPGSRITLFPLERIEDRARHRFAVTPPWLKTLWRDPEAETTA